jgi:phospholipase/carboxylesterase
MIATALLALAQIAQGTPSPSIAPPAVAAPSPARQGRLIDLPDGAVAYIPASASAHPPLLVLLHGAGHGHLEGVVHQEAEAEARGIVVLGPSSFGPTWDVVAIAEEPPSPGSSLARQRAQRFSGSRDANRVEAAIAALAKVVPVDRSRTVLAGISDGATMALAMGMSRDHAFSAVIAWSPGIALRAASPARGRKVFVSHGRKDPMLPFEVSCGEIVPMLQGEGAAITFLPFDGVHEAPLSVKDAFFDAAFGPVPGSTAMPLPARVETCMPPSRDQRLTM